MMLLMSLEERLWLQMRHVIWMVGNVCMSLYCVGCMLSICQVGRVPWQRFPQVHPGRAGADTRHKWRLPLQLRVLFQSVPL